MAEDIGKLKKRILGMVKTKCIHAPEEDEQGNITQKIHDSWREPSKEEINQILDEAKQELFTFLKKYVQSNKKLTKEWLLIQYEEWTAKWFGETPYETWLEEVTSP